MEEWKQIKEGYYEVSTIGNIRSVKTSKIIKTHHSTKDYVIIGLYIDGKRKRFSVHRLVAEAFVENIDNKPFVDHINRIRDDNRVENLRWVTHLENMQNQTRGVITKKMIKKIIGLHKAGHNVDFIEKEINGYIAKMVSASD